MEKIKEINMTGSGIEICFESGNIVRIGAEDAVELSKWIVLYGPELRDIGNVRGIGSISKFYREEDDDV